LLESGHGKGKTKGGGPRLLKKGAKRWGQGGGIQSGGYKLPRVCPSKQQQKRTEEGRSKKIPPQKDGLHL